MAKKRRTKKQKIKAQERRTQQSNQGFVIPKSSLKTNKKKKKTATRTEKNENEFLQADLTKTLLVTMLALALELACWRLL